MDDLRIADGFFLKKSKWLVHALIVSLTLNCALIATFSFFALKKNHKEEAAGSLKKKIRPASEMIASALKNYFSQPLPILIKELQDETLVEAGQRRCDLALACLVTLYHFDLEKALGGALVEKREVAFSLDGKPVRFPLFAGLSQNTYLSILAFAESEVYPFTPEGLFKMLSTDFQNSPPALREAFFYSSEFHLIERALFRAGFKGKKEQLLHLLLALDWEKIAAFANEVRVSDTGTFESLGFFLESFIEKGDPLAAQLLIELDKEYAIKRLSDSQLKTILSLAEPSSEKARAFFEEVSTSVRADRLRQQAIESFLPEKRLEKKEKPQKVQSQTYVVKYGDSLWKIGRQYGISLQAIKELNALETSSLFPGQVLIIPERE